MTELSHTFRTLDDNDVGCRFMSGEHRDDRTVRPSIFAAVSPSLDELPRLEVLREPPLCADHPPLDASHSAFGDGKRLVSGGCSGGARKLGGSTGGNNEPVLGCRKGGKMSDDAELNNNGK